MKQSQSVLDALADAETLRRNCPQGGFWQHLHNVPVASTVYRWTHSFMGYREAQATIVKVAHSAFRACPELRS